MTEDIFGPLVSTNDVEEAVLNTLRVWIPEWLAAIERKRGMQPRILSRPPAPESYHGGDDFDSWKSDLLPEYIVNIKTDSVERESSAGYTVAYEIEIATIVERQSEEETRFHASLHGAALQFLVQQGALGGIAERTVMTAAPMPEFLDPSERRLGRSIARFMTWVVPVVSENLGPAAPNPAETPQYKGPEEEWGAEPIATTVSEILHAAVAYQTGREWASGKYVEENGVFYKCAKTQLASEVHRPSEDLAGVYWQPIP